MSGLIEFAGKYQVTSAHFTAIGAISGATSGFFDPQRKMCKKILIDEVFMREQNSPITINRQETLRLSLAAS